MQLPPLAPVPPADVRQSLRPEDWEACLDTWTQLLDVILRLPPAQVDVTNDDSIVPFLRSYFHEVAQAKPNDGTFRSANARSLQSICSKLLQRTLLRSGNLDEHVDWDLLSDTCRIYFRSPAFHTLMGKVWARKGNDLQPMLQKKKTSLTNGLESSHPKDLDIKLNELIPVMRCSPEIATFFATGTDFLDGLTSAYAKVEKTQLRKAAVTIVYFGLVSCVTASSPNVSLLSDHLYSLKAQADKLPAAQSLLADLVTNTPFVAKLRRTISGKSQDRLIKLLDSLETYRTPSIATARKRVRRKVDKGKARQNLSDNSMNVHQMSLVTQIQDLFPELGSGFVLRLLEEYNDDVEQVTARLLDDSLPEHLKSLDRSATAPFAEQDQQHQIEDLAPADTAAAMEPYLPSRKNVFDNDELDRLEFDTSRLHLGKKEHAPSSDARDKAAILSALAAFDSDDDERDDTYDIEDVGGTVDNAHPDGEPDVSSTSKPSQDEEMDLALFAAYKASPELFGRTFDVRRGQARAALKAETRMTDEAIEGWAIMLQRDPRRLKRLEDRHGAFSGRQTELARTSYRESPAGTETEDSDAPSGSRGGYRGRGRGQGGAGRGRGGGNVAGPSGDANTVAAQKRKEANKGSRANHNRRDQRAKKMARGGFAG